MKSLLSSFRSSPKSLYILTAVTVLCLSGASSCTWVKPTEEAKKLDVVQAKDVLQCELVGNTTSSVKDRVGMFKRDQEKVANELITLAKNSAVALGGDTLVAMTDPIDGSQKFAVYRCTN